MSRRLPLLPPVAAGMRGGPFSLSLFVGQRREMSNGFTGKRTFCSPAEISRKRVESVRLGAALRGRRGNGTFFDFTGVPWSVVASETCSPEGFRRFSAEKRLWQVASGSFRCSLCKNAMNFRGKEGEECFFAQV